MSLDVFRRDIANVLRATAYATDGPADLAQELIDALDLPPDTEADVLICVYRQGVRHALISVGLAFGLEPVAPSEQHTPEVTPGLAGLLWAEMPRER